MNKKKTKSKRQGEGDWQRLGARVVGEGVPESVPKGQRGECLRPHRDGFRVAFYVTSRVRFGQEKKSRRQGRTPLLGQAAPRVRAPAAATPARCRSPGRREIQPQGASLAETRTKKSCIKLKKQQAAFSLGDQYFQHSHTNTYSKHRAVYSNWGLLHVQPYSEK